MNILKPHFYLADPERGGFWYHMPQGHSSVGYVANGDIEMTAVEDSKWYWSPVRAETIEKTSEGYCETTGYELRPGAIPFKGIDRNLSQPQYQQLYNDADENLRTILNASYNPIKGERIRQKLGMDLSEYIELIAQPPSAIKATFRAHLPIEIQHRPEYVYLFPGNLEGFQAWTAEALNKLPGVKVYTNSSFTIYFEQMLHGKKQTREIKLGFRVPDKIEGVNRADAEVKWLALFDKIKAHVDGSIQVCPACEGHGMIQVKKEEGVKAL